MARYKVLSHLNHNLVIYQAGEEIDLNQNDPGTQELLKANVVEYLPPSHSSGEPTQGKPVVPFHAPTSEAEITKAVEKSKIPNPEVTCGKCKVKRILTDYQIVKMKGDKIAVRGICPVCGSNIFRPYGKAKLG